MTKAEVQQAFETAATSTIAPMVKILTGALKMKLPEAKAKAMNAREENASFEAAWKELSAKEKEKIKKFKG